MQKTAQKRSLLNKLREKTNIGGIATENFFDPEFKEIMDKLRADTDDPIRAIISGQQIGDYIPDDKLSLKDILKSARSNFNTKEYMKCVADLGRFHKRVNDIVSRIKAFDSNLDKVHHRFLFDELKPETAGYNREYAEYLHDLKQRFTPPPAAKKANYDADMLIINAGIIDFFKNIGTERGRALSAWEKRYPGRVKELKSTTLRLIDHSEKLLSGMITVLKAMATARATRKVDDYVKHAHRIVAAYKTYDDSFKTYYDSQVKKFLDTQELLFPSKSVDTSTETGSQDIGDPKSEPVVDPSSIGSTTIDPPSAPENVATTTQQAILADPLQVPWETSLDEAKQIVEKRLQQTALDVPPPPPKRKGKANQPGPQATQLGAGALQRAQKAQQQAVHVDNRTPEQLEAARIEAQRVADIKAAPNPLAEKQKRDLAALRAEKARAAQQVIQQQSAPQQAAQQQVDQDVESGLAGSPEIAQLLQQVSDRQSSGSHNKFINSLESLSNEHPIILSKFILKYAQGIKTSDPDTYDKLINIVESIKV
jgi:hypothetical protein